MSSNLNSDMWSVDELWAKSQLYVQRALDADRDSSLYPFWMSLALEFIARAALSKISPVLNADPRDETNIYFGLGIESTGSPKTIPIHAVYSRCMRLVPGFESSHRVFCDFLGFQRNAELHTGSLPFENLKLQDWLKDYYAVAEVLCQHLGRDLDDLFGNDEAEAARELLKASEEGLETSVKSTISAHKKVFEEKEDKERLELRNEALVRCHISDELSEAADCPACESPNMVRGKEIGRSRPYYVEGDLLEDITIQSQSYSCRACGLNLPTLAHVQWSGIAPRFNVVMSTDLHQLQEFDYYEPEYMNE